MMSKKSIVIPMIVISGFCLFSPLQAGETTVGGHLKLTLYDRPTGKSNGTQSSNYVGFSFRALYLYLSHQLTEKVSIDVQPEWSASTGATPKLGSPVAKKSDASKVEPGFSGFVKAQVNVILPCDYELGFGIVKPRFSWDYGAELFWEDQLNAGKFTANTDLGAMHDGGIEIYKNYELGKVSLPTYLYILNGGYEFSDNNSQPGFMATVEPEAGPFKLKGSFHYRKYDNEAKYAFIKYLFGAAFEKGLFSARAEYAAGIWENKVTSKGANGAVLMQDGNPKGYYFKFFYRITPWCRAMLHYDSVNYDYSGTAPGMERYRTFIPGMQLYVSNSSMIQIQYDIADWNRIKSGVEDKLRYNRLTVGWRTTF